MRFQNKVVLVTGASQGIGATLALMLASEGAKVACAARSKDGLGLVVDRVTGAGGEAISIPTDVSSREAIAAAVSETVTRFGRLDALVNNAALVGHRTSIFDPLDAFEAEMRVNLTGALAAIIAAIPHLRQSGGRILNVSSLLALNYMPGMFAYGVSKLALERMTIDVAEQLRTDGVSCNALRIDLPVFPGGKPRTREGMDPEAIKEIQVMAQYAEPLETGAAAMAWMLAQDIASYSGRLESLRSLISRREVEGTAEQLMPQEFASRWSW